MVNDKQNRKASHVLNQALRVLEFTMDLAVQKQDIDAMIGISDRLMVLYQHLSEGSIKKFKPGFALVEKEELNEQSDEH
jgi:hypothetical protein